jgi:hypothetical protein
MYAGQVDSQMICSRPEMISLYNSYLLQYEITFYNLKSLMLNYKIILRKLPMHFYTILQNVSLYVIQKNSKALNNSLHNTVITILICKRPGHGGEEKIPPSAGNRFDLPTCASLIYWLNISALLMSQIYMVVHI